MFAAKLIPEIQRLKRAATPRDSEDIFFTTGPDGFEARLRQKPKPAAAAPAPAETAAAYNGMFKVTDTTDYSPLSDEPPGAVAPYQVTIAAGIAQCESKFVSVAIEEDMELTTQTGYLTLEFDVDTESGAITQEYKLETLGNVTADLDLYKGRCIIAQIEKPDDRLVITQLQHNIALVSIRTPEVPEEEEE